MSFVRISVAGAPQHLGIQGCFGIAEPARSAHQAHHDLVRDAHHDVALDLVIRHFGRGVVREDRQAALDAGNILEGIVHEQIDVLRETASAVGDDGEASDEEVPGAGLVQRPAETDDVVGLRRAGPEIIILVVHASASSNEEKR